MLLASIPNTSSTIGPFHVLIAGRLTRAYPVGVTRNPSHTDELLLTSPCSSLRLDPAELSSMVLMLARDRACWSRAASASRHTYLWYDPGLLIRSADRSPLRATRTIRKDKTNHHTAALCRHAPNDLDTGDVSILISRLLARHWPCIRRAMRPVERHCLPRGATPLSCVVR